MWCILWKIDSQFVFGYVVGCYGLLAGVLLQYKPLRNRAGTVLSSLTAIFVIACEFLVPAERWHNVRGAQMVLSMKGKMLVSYAITFAVIFMLLIGDCSIVIY